MDERERDVDRSAAGGRPPGDQPRDVVVAEDSGPASSWRRDRRRVEVGDDGAGDVLRPDRLEPGLALAGDRQQGEQGEPPHDRHPGVVAVVDDRRGEDGGRQLGVAHALSASAFARKKRVRWNSVAPIAEKKTKRRRPRLRRAAVARCQAVELLDRGGGWSRIDAARWITVSTPRSAWRVIRGSPSSVKSPSASAPRPASAPAGGGRGRGTRTSSPRSSSRGNSGRPTVPVAPVTRIIARNSRMARSILGSPGTTSRPLPIRPERPPRATTKGHRAWLT